VFSSVCGIWVRLQVCVDALVMLLVSHRGAYYIVLLLMKTLCTLPAWIGSMLLLAILIGLIWNSLNVKIRRNDYNVLNNSRIKHAFNAGLLQKI